MIQPKIMWYFHQNKYHGGSSVSHGKTGIDIQHEYHSTQYHCLLQWTSCNMRIINYIGVISKCTSITRTFYARPRKTAFMILMLYGIDIDAFITIDIYCYDTHACSLLHRWLHFYDYDMPHIMAHWRKWLVDKNLCVMPKNCFQATYSV